MTIRRGSLVLVFGRCGWGRAPGEVRAGLLHMSWSAGSVLDELGRAMAALRDARDRLRGGR